MAKTKVYCNADADVDVDSFFETIREEWSDKDKIDFIMDIAESFFMPQKSLKTLNKKLEQLHYGD